VLWTTDPIPGAKEALVKLCQTKKKTVYFVTKNSTKSRVAYCKKLKETLGVDFIQPSQIFCSAFLASWHLQKKWENDQKPRKVYVVGESGIVDECKSFGYKVSGGPEDAHKECSTVEKALEIPDSEIEGIDAVVVGWDKCFNYYKLVFASLCLQRNPNCQLIATNRSIVFFHFFFF
jgi:ribonucleotide monophosphatase NagD (HAD superfamily)